MDLRAKKYEVSFRSLLGLIPKPSRSFEPTKLSKPKAVKFLALFTILFAVAFGFNLFVYKNVFSYTYEGILYSLFQFKTEFFNLFLILPFSLLFLLVFVLVVSFSGVFEKSDGVYASIIVFITIMVESILMLGHSLVTIVSSLFIAVAIPYAMNYIRKRLGLFKVRQLFWKGTYILFIAVSLSLALAFFTSFLVDLDYNILATKQAFINAPSIGSTSGLDALKNQIRQAYIIGFMEGVDYQAGSNLTDFERQLAKEEAKSRASEILESARGLQILSQYAEEFPYFNTLLILIPILISAAIFSLSFLFFTFVLRPICVVLSLLLYEKLMRLYIRLNY